MIIPYESEEMEIVPIVFVEFLSSAVFGPGRS